MILHKYNRDMRTKVWFPTLNKQNTIEEYESQTSRTPQNCKVTHVAIMDEKEYHEFATNLLTDRDWLAGLGGHDADGEWPEGSFFTWPEEKREQFKRESYRCIIEVQSPERRTLYVDPQGYDYARYVGFTT